MTLLPEAPPATDRRRPSPSGIRRLSKQLRQHERHDDRRFQRIDERLGRIETRILVLMLLVGGTGVANHFLTGIS